MTTQTSQTTTPQQIIEEIRLSKALTTIELNDKIGHLDTNKPEDLITISRILDINQNILLQAHLLANPPPQQYIIEQTNGCWMWTSGNIITQSTLYEDAYLIQNKAHCSQPHYNLYCNNPFHLIPEPIVPKAKTYITLELAKGETQARIKERIGITSITPEHNIIPTIRTIYKTAWSWYKQKTIIPQPYATRQEFFMAKLTYLNTEIWNNEELCRTDDHNKIIEGKLNVNTLNQQRNDCIEQLDNIFLLDQNGLGTPTTETPGSALDRISIMVLKLLYRAKDTITIQAEMLIGQIIQLIRATCQLIYDIEAGTRYCHRQQQFKSYQPPRKETT